MMRQHFFLPALLALLLGGSIWNACTKASSFGADKFGDQTADFDFTDTITVNCTLQREERTPTSNFSNSDVYQLCGELNDPILGKTKADIYTLFLPSTAYPVFTTQQYDSVVLFLRYASNGVYGDTLVPQTLTVSRLNADLDWRSTKTYYSDDKIEAGQQIASYNFLPKPRTVDSIPGVTTKAAFLRVKLDDAFGQALFTADSLKVNNDTIFWQSYKGLKISCTANGANPGAMLAFNLNNAAYSFIRVYHTRDTIHDYDDLYFQNNHKFVGFTQDYTGAQVESLIGQTSNDLIIVQGGAGLKMQVEFPYIEQLQDIVVNQARLVLTVNNTLSQDLPTLLTPLSQVAYTQVRPDSTDFIYTTDVLYSTGPTGTGGFASFGGAPKKANVNGTEVTRYYLSTTVKLQDMIDTENTDPNKKKLFINAAFPGLTAQRLIAYGPKSTTFPAKLELKYTRLNQ